MKVIAPIQMPDTWDRRRGKFLFERIKRSPSASEGVVTAFRDGQVTLRSNRREDGFTNAELEIGYQGIRVGDLVIHGMDGFAGAIGVSDSDGKASPVVHAYRGLAGNDPRFYAYLLRDLALKGFIASLAKGIRERSTAFDSEMFKCLVLPLPPVSEQKAIADYLDHETYRIEALIEKYRGLESLLELRDLSMVYKYIFGEESSLESVDRRAYSMQLRRVVLQTNAGEVIDKSWWGAGNERLYTCAREVLDSNYENFPDWKRTQRSDLLITRNGTPYIHIPLENSIYSNVVQRINIGNQYSREYIAFALEAVVGGMKAQGVSIDSFNYDMWKSLVIPIPGIEIQREIANDIVKSKIQLGKVRELVQTQISLLNEQRQALITAAVTGELEIPEVAA